MVEIILDEFVSATDPGPRVYPAPRVLHAGLLERDGHHRGQLLHGLLLPHHCVSTDYSQHHINYNIATSTSTAARGWEQRAIQLLSSNALHNLIYQTDSLLLLFWNTNDNT